MTVAVFAHTAQAAEPLILCGPECRAFSLAYSSDGQRLAVAYEDGSLRVWDLVGGAAPVVREQAHANHCRSVAWGADDETVWTTGDEGMLKCWESCSGKPRGEPIEVNKPYCVVACRTPERLAVASRDGMVRLITSASGAEDATKLTGHDGPVRWLALAPDGRRLASVGHDHTLCIWGLEQQKQLKALPGGGQGRLFAVAWASRPEVIAVAGDGGTIELFDVAAGKPIARWKAHDREIRSLSFARDGRYLASAGEDVEVRIWKTDGGKLLQALPGHKVKAYGVACSPTDDTVAVGRADGRVELWREVAPN